MADPAAYAQGPIMADPVMVRILDAQAEAIWPLEAPLFERYGLDDAGDGAGCAGARILDVACGTGEATLRLAERFPRASLTGVDLVGAHVRAAAARAEAAGLGGRARFVAGDAYALPVADASADLALCRHVLQAIRHPERVIDEMRRAVRPGGWLHVLAEDYGLIWFHPTRLDNVRFWLQGPVEACRRTGSDLLQGRKAPALLLERGLADVRVDYLIVDTLRVPRAAFARIWEGWRDGYAGFIADNTDLPRAEVDAHWEDMLACLRNPAGYGCWAIPVVSARVPCDP